MVVPAWIYLYANGDKYEENRTNDLSIFYLTELFIESIISDTFSRTDHSPYKYNKRHIPRGKV